MQRNQECEEKCKAGKNDHCTVNTSPRGLAVSCSRLQPVQTQLLQSILDRYYLSDLCNLEERLLRGLNIIGDESNEPAADLPFSAKVSISNVLTELWFTKIFWIQLEPSSKRNFIDAFEMEYGKQPAPNMAKLWSILQMIERKKIKTYECDKVSLMRRHNSNTDILDDCMQSDLANNFLLKTSNLSTSNRNSASDDEDDVSYKSSPKLYTGDTVEASTLDIFAGPNVVGNSLFTRYQEITSPDTNVYILGAIDESNLNAGSNMNDSPRSNGRSNVGNSHQRDDLLSGRNYNGTKEDSLFMFNLKYIPFSQMQVKQICCGGQHASALTEALQVYTWGRGTFGRLGHGNTARIKQPKLIESLTNAKIVKIACGFAYSACVSSDGELYTWGPVKTVGWEMDRLRMYTGRQSCQGYPKRTLLEFLRDLCILV